MSVHCTWSSDVTRSVIVYAVIYFKLDLTEENRNLTLAFLFHAVLLSSFLAQMKEMSPGLGPKNWPGKVIFEGQIDDSKRPGLIQLTLSTGADDPFQALSHNLLIFLYIYFKNRRRWEEFFSPVQHFERKILRSILRPTFENDFNLKKS